MYEADQLARQQEVDATMRAGTPGDRSVRGRIDYTIDIGGRYGEMPPALLTQKFEQTETANDEMLYDSYARATLVDLSADKNAFEYEEARGRVNDRAGRIQLMYYGHRGDADDPYRPEFFDGFGGARQHTQFGATGAHADPLVRDPRGIAVDPDFKEIRRQQDARTRFYRFTPENYAQVTSGARSADKIMRDQQLLRKLVRDRVRIFDRQLDGRRTGLRRDYPHRSAVNKQIAVQSYGDYITDKGLSIQRKANILTNYLLRDTREWRNETIDADLELAKYNQVCRKRKVDSKFSPVAAGLTSVEGDFSAHDQTKNYKALAILMQSLTQNRELLQQLAKKSDIEFASARQFAIAKTAPITRDLGIITRAIQVGGLNSTADTYAAGKSAPLQDISLAAQHTRREHLTPAHHLLNAEIIYKSARAGEDARKIADSLILDATTVAAFTPVRRGRTNTDPVGGAADATATARDAAFTTADGTPANYKRLVQDAAMNVQASTQARLDSVSDPSQTRRPNHQGYQVTPAQAHGMQFLDNTQHDRLAAPLGTKYMRAFMDRETPAHDDAPNELVGAQRTSAHRKG